MVSVQAVVERYKAALTVTFPRSSYLPAAVRDKEPTLTPEGTDLAIWLWEENGKYYGIAFQGKANKPLWFYHFSSEASRKRQVDDTIELRKSLLKNKADKLEQRRNFKHPYEIGSVLYTSWGYDQTNVDFYEVVELKGKDLVIRGVSKKVDSTHSDSGTDYVSAIKGKYNTQPFRVRPTPNGVKIEGHYGHLWDGKPKYETATGWGH